MNHAPVSSPVIEQVTTSSHTPDVVARLQKSDLFRDYQQSFQAITGLPLTLRAAGAFAPPLQGSRQINPFCALLATRNKSCAACLQLQQQIEDGASTGPKTLECFTGLNESAVPVRVGAQVIAYLQTGQVLLRPPSAARFRKITSQLDSWDTKLDEKQLRAAYFQTRVLDRSQYESVLRLLNIFAQHLSSFSNQLMLQEAAAEPPVITKARQYVAEHHAEVLTLRQVAQAVHTSAFYFCKIFKHYTGLTFTHYLARVRVEKVKELLLNPHTRVSEAAYEAGFQSLSQFNRVFQRVAGESPSAYRERIHSAPRPGGGNGSFTHHAHAA
jgi:AraC-like DNA-binding protein/ligand-binding sensor protein